MRSPVTALASGVLPYADTDRPAEDDELVQRIAHDFKVSPVFVANLAEEMSIDIFRKTKTRPSLEDVLCAIEASGTELLKAATKKARLKRKKSRAS